MEVLELKPVSGKKVYLYLIKKEDRELFESEYEDLKEIIKNRNFRFAIVDFNDNDSKELYQTALLKFLDNFNLPYYNIDIPEYAKNYLYHEVLRHEVQISELEAEYENLYLNQQQDTFKAQNLKSWIDHLKMEVEYKKKNLELSVKPKWIVKKVLDIVNEIKNDKLSILQFAPEKLFSELKSLFEKYNIKVIRYDINKIDIKSIVIHERI